MVQSEWSYFLCVWPAVWRTPSPSVSGEYSLPSVLWQLLAYLWNAQGGDLQSRPLPDTAAQS